MSVTAADGFVAAGGAIGIKAAGAPDLALVATADGRAVPAAAVFTAQPGRRRPRCRSSRPTSPPAGVGPRPWCSRRATPTPPPGPEGVAAAEALCALAAADLACGPHRGPGLPDRASSASRFPMDAVAARLPGVLVARAASGAAGRTRRPAPS